jgi:hypothetical protein
VNSRNNFKWKINECLCAAYHLTTRVQPSIRYWRSCTGTWKFCITQTRFQFRYIIDQQQGDLSIGILIQIWGTRSIQRLNYLHIAKLTFTTRGVNFHSHVPKEILTWHCSPWEFQHCFVTNNCSNKILNVPWQHSLHSDKGN